MSAAATRIKRVGGISSFGLFRSFVGAATLHDFDRYNLVYGWNYSGKTTFSRVLQCIEHGTVFPDCPNAAFDFELTDGTHVTQATQPTLLPVRVFNRDFVEKNFHQGSDMTGVPAIAVIGAENKALKDRLTVFTERLNKVLAFVQRIKEERQNIQGELDSAGTTKARDIDRIFAERFRRDHLFSAVMALPTNAEAAILDEATLAGKTTEWRNAGQYRRLSELKPVHSAFIGSLYALRSALGSVASNRAIARLQNNPDLAGWVRAGIHLHSPGSGCEFCGNVVTQQRWDELRAHFSDAYEQLRREVHRLHELYSAFDDTITTVSERDVFPELHPRLTEVIAEIENSVKIVAADVAVVVKRLTEKSQKLDALFSLPGTLAGAKLLRAALRKYNDLVADHNRRVNTVGEVQRQARTALLNHYAAEFDRDTSYRNKRKEINQLDQRIADAANVATRIQAQIAETDRAIKSASIGPKLINENLSLLLPGDSIHAVKLNDTDFQIQRDGAPAARMSDGERTAVAFAYFLAKMQEGTIPLSDVVLVIDDPISSLDSNHIYAVHGIIEARLSTAKQLFVLTHNSTFFGITRDWMKKKNGRFFMTSRQTAAGNAPFTELIPLPRLLKEFKSDYQYTYYCLKVIDAEANPSLESLCGVPNMVRRLLEAYLGFVLPESGGWGDKLEKLFTDPAKCAAVKKFADDNSHAHSLSQAMEVANYISHSKGIIRDVLDALRTHNPAHIQSLEAEFNPANGALP